MAPERFSEEVFRGESQRTLRGLHHWYEGPLSGSRGTQGDWKGVCPLSFIRHTGFQKLKGAIKRCA
jgi:hypothetical protein